MKNRTEKTPDELLVIVKAYDLAREIMHRVAKYPKSHRFVLGDRTLNAVYDLLDLLIEAKYTSTGKAVLLERANIVLARMRFTVRMACDEKFIGIRGYEFLARSMDEVGRLIGGWRKSRLK